jgi:hypothetical protein
VGVRLSPAHHKAAADLDCLAGDFLGARRGEEDSYRRDVIGLLPAAELDRLSLALAVASKP